jgi:hypothetical protein
MPAFTTPEPITATVQVAGARVRITASDRTDTTVLVQPINETSRSDVRVAEKTKVDFAGGRLSVKTTAPGDKNGSVAITIDMPAESSLVAYLAHSSVQAAAAADPPQCGPGRRGVRTARRRRRRVLPSTGSRPSAPRPALPAAPSATGKPSAARHSLRRRAAAHPKSNRRASRSGLRDLLRARGRSTARATGRPARRRGRRRPCEPRMVRASRSAPSRFCHGRLAGPNC